MKAPRAGGDPRTDWRAYEEWVAGSYLDYQKRYAESIRESDRVVIRILRELIAPRGGPQGLELLDVGCSTGNLLRHLRAALPGLGLTGGDVFPGIIEHCRADPSLAGMGFELMDARDIPGAARFDFVVTGSVLFLFDNEGFESAISSIARALKPGGHLIAWEPFNPFEEELTIYERSEVHPNGLSLHLRSYAETGSLLQKHGFTDPSFQPYEIPIDIPKPHRSADVSGYTVRLDTGKRLTFRGALWIPWCHLVARRQA